MSPWMVPLLTRKVCYGKRYPAVRACLCRGVRPWLPWRRRRRSGFLSSLRMSTCADRVHYVICGFRDVRRRTLANAHLAWAPRALAISDSDGEGGEAGRRHGDVHVSKFDVQRTVSSLVLDHRLNVHEAIILVAAWWHCCNKYMPTDLTPALWSADKITASVAAFLLGGIVAAALCIEGWPRGPAIVSTWRERCWACWPTACCTLQ